MLVAALTQSSELTERLAASVAPTLLLEITNSLERLQEIVVDQPVTTVLLDVATIKALDTQSAYLSQLRKLYPSLGIIIVADLAKNPKALFNIGRAGVRNLVVMDVEEIEGAFTEGVRQAEAHGATAVVTEALAPHVPELALSHIRTAMHGACHRWGPRKFGEVLGLSPFPLHTQLLDADLPTAGALLVWTRIFHAAAWLFDPGRSAESVARQLGYTGWSLRRALRANTGTTPTELIAAGGLAYALGVFMQRCGFRMGDEWLNLGHLFSEHELEGIRRVGSSQTRSSVR